MSEPLDFVSLTDKPALLGLSTPELLEAAHAALQQLGYKVHTAESHGDFLNKFNQTPYQVVMLEEAFCAKTSATNESLIALQNMSMSRRRHAVIILFGFSFTTLDPMEAFQHGVHAVINPSEAYLLIQLIQKVVVENDLFLHTFREAQKHAA